jgi:hypothetical protein
MLDADARTDHQPPREECATVGADAAASTAASG